MAMGSILILFIFVSSTFARPDHLLLYNDSVNLNEQIHPSEDDACDISYLHNITMFSLNFSEIFVCTNGIVSLNYPLLNYTPMAFPLPSQRTVIAPFWADADPWVAGDIFARVETNGSGTVIRELSESVEEEFKVNFTADWMLVVTWHKLIPYAFGQNYIGNSSYKVKMIDERNTFQLVLLTEGINAYAVFNYDTLEWHRDYYKGQDENISAQVGFDLGDGVNYYSVEGSRTENIGYVRHSSNINQTGRWMFGLSAREIDSPGDPMKTQFPLTTSTTEPSTTQLSSSTSNPTPSTALSSTTSSSAASSSTVQPTTISSTSSQTSPKLQQQTVTVLQNATTVEENLGTVIIAGRSKKKKRRTAAAVAVPLTLMGVLGTAGLAVFFWRRRRKEQEEE